MVVTTYPNVTSKYWKGPVFSHSHSSHPWSGSSTVLFLRKSPIVPSDATSIQGGLNLAKPGQIVHVDAGSAALTANITVQDNKKLKIHNNINLGDSHIITAGTGQIQVDSDVDYICIKTGSTIKSLHGTLAAACSTASSGETIEVHGTNSVNNNATVPSGVTMSVPSGSVLQFASGKKLEVIGTLEADDATFTGSSWYGIEFNYGSSSSYIQNCTIRYATYGVRMIGTNVRIYNNTIRNNTTGLLFENNSDGTSVVNSNQVIYNSSCGIKCLSYSDPLLFTGNVITDNGYGLGGVRGDGTSCFDLGIYSDQGHNSIYYNDPYEVYSLYGGTTYARYNWWGDSNPSPTVSNGVDWLYYLTSPPFQMLLKGGGKSNAFQPVIATQAVSTDTLGITQVDSAYKIFRQGNYEQAAAAFESIVHKYPDHFSGQRALAFLRKCYQHQKNEQEIIPLLDRISLMYEDKKITALAQHLKSGELIRNEKYAPAITACDHVKTFFAESEFNKYALFNLGTIYWYHLDDPQIGERYFRQLIATYPDDDLSISALATLGEWDPEAQKRPDPDKQDMSGGAVVNTFVLQQNYPNPFNPTTTIPYQLPETCQMTIKIYNIMGQIVTTLVDGTQPAGAHLLHWNGQDDFGRMVGNGVYWIHMQAGQFVTKRKVVLLR